VGEKAPHCQPAQARLSSGSDEVIRLWSGQSVVPGSMGRCAVPSRTRV
jgi:hypothetical protein